MVRILGKQFTLKKEDIWIWAAWALALIYGWLQYDAGKPFFWNLDKVAWLIVPFFVPIIGYVVIARRLPSFHEEIIIEDPKVLLVQFLNSGVKAYSAEPCDKIAWEETIPFPNEGNIAFRLKLNSTHYWLYMDGRKNIDAQQRAGTYIFLSVTRMQEAGFRNIYDLHKKVSKKREGMTVAQILTELPDEAQVEVLKSMSSGVIRGGNE